MRLYTGWNSTKFSVRTQRSFSQPVNRITLLSARARSGNIQDFIARCFVCIDLFIRVKGWVGPENNPPTPGEQSINRYLIYKRPGGLSRSRRSVGNAPEGCHRDPEGRVFAFHHRYLRCVLPWG